MTHGDLGFDFAVVLAEHDEVGDLYCVSGDQDVWREGWLAFSASDQAAPLAPVLFGVFCSVSDMLAILRLAYACVLGALEGWTMGMEDDESGRKVTKQEVQAVASFMGSER